MWVLPKEKMCFLANPKTASLATAFALETLGFKSFGDQHCIPAASGWGQWREIDNTWTVFSTVRHHLDLMVSWYFHNTKKPGVSKYFGWPFERFLYEWSSNPKWFRNHQVYWERAPLCTRILRFETLQADLCNLLTSCGLSCPPLQRHNVSKNRRGRACHEFYSEKSIEFMVSKFGAEMTLYDYSHWI